MNDKIRFYHSDSGDLIGRDCFVIAFFTHGGYDAILHGVPVFFEQWYNLLPPGSIQWSLTGANAKRFHPVDEDNVQKVRTYILPDKAAQREHLYLELRGGNHGNCPAYRFILSGEQAPDNEDQNSLIELCFPSEFPIRVGYEQIVEIVRSFAEIIHYTSAYASPSLIHGREDADHLEQAIIKLGPFAMRHPGYDLAENMSSSLVLGKHSRGARWLTLLGEELVEQLGGKETIEKSLDHPIKTYDAGKGILIRASEAPELGDVNRAQGPIILPIVAKTIFPVTFFGDNAPFQAYFDDEKVQDMTDRWEERFID